MLRSRTQAENAKKVDHKIILAFLGNQRAKITFTRPSPSQLQQLQKYFQISEYLNEDSRSKLLKDTGLRREQINKWFANKRHENKWHEKRNQR